MFEVSVCGQGLQEILATLGLRVSGLKTQTPRPHMESEVPEGQQLCHRHGALGHLLPAADLRWGVSHLSDASVTLLV